MRSGMNRYTFCNPCKSWGGGFYGWRCREEADSVLAGEAAAGSCAGNSGLVEETPCSPCFNGGDGCGCGCRQNRCGPNCGCCQNRCCGNWEC